VRRLCAQQRLLEIDPEQAGRLLRARGAGVRELRVAALPADYPPPAWSRCSPTGPIGTAQARWQFVPAR